MIRFLDGPAAATGWRGLTLRRAPLYLRVVIGPAGELDALDQFYDAPRPDETIVVYRRQGKPGVVHVDFTRRGKGQRRSGWYVTATYQMVEPQPDDATLRDVAAWRAWAIAQRDSDRRAAAREAAPPAGGGEA